MGLQSGRFLRRPWLPCLPLLLQVAEVLLWSQLALVLLLRFRLLLEPSPLGFLR